MTIDHHGYEFKYVNRKKVYTHRLNMEIHLGRPLITEEIVHHINCDKLDNRIENLQLVTQSEHATIHGKEKIKQYITLICPNCKQEFEKELKLYKFNSNKGQVEFFCSHKCAAIFRDVCLNFDNVSKCRVS